MNTKKVTFKTENVNKPTPKFWRKFGNAFLVFATGFPMAISQFVIDPTLEDNLCAVVSVIALAIKATTTFFAEER
ncbi:MAG: hypothetical protein ACEPOW_13760 [Bacteroidales bacterium]